MSDKIVDIDFRAELLDRFGKQLTDEYSKEAFKKGANLLVKITRQQLIQRLPNAATKKSKNPYTKRPLADQIKLKENFNDWLKVHIMSDYRLKWFEKGTAQRMQGGRRRKVSGSNEYVFRKNKSEGLRRKTSNNPSTGAIKPLNFFAVARQDNRIWEVIFETMNKLSST